MGSDIELASTAVIAPGQWYTVTLVDEDLTPILVDRHGGQLEDRPPDR
jgi:hypothetical protein